MLKLLVDSPTIKSCTLCK